jgi:hypothetical protein
MGVYLWKKRWGLWVELHHHFSITDREFWLLNYTGIKVQIMDFEDWWAVLDLNQHSTE